MNQSSYNICIYVPLKVIPIILTYYWVVTKTILKWSDLEMNGHK